jgi:hypothetical protein
MLRKKKFPFRLFQLSPRPGCQIAKLESTNLHSDQSQSWVADRSGHAADLPILSFDEL